MAFACNGARRRGPLVYIASCIEEEKRKREREGIREGGRMLENMSGGGRRLERSTRDRRRPVENVRP